MVYYKVKDNFADRKFGEILLVKNELFTKKEIENNNLPMIAFCKVNVPKNRVYCLFGARFDSMEDEFTSETYKKYNLLCDGVTFNESSDGKEIEVGFLLKDLNSIAF